MTYVTGSKVNTSIYGKGKVIERGTDAYKIKLDKPYGGVTVKTISKDKVRCL